jgi:hypothetical protein
MREFTLIGFAAHLGMMGREIHTSMPRSLRRLAR